MRGFYLIVTSTKRSFYVQSLVNGRQVRTKLADHPAMDAKQARDAARRTLLGMRGGTNPNEERRRALPRAHPAGGPGPAPELPAAGRQDPQRL